MSSGLIIFASILQSSLCARLGSCLEGVRHRTSAQLRSLVVLLLPNSLIVAGQGAGHSKEMKGFIAKAPLC